jgi:hypothetical protein
MCKQEFPEEEPFSVPWDPIGAEIMKAHLKDKHNEVVV